MTQTIDYFRCQCGHQIQWHDSQGHCVLCMKKNKWCPKYDPPSKDAPKPKPPKRRSYLVSF